VKPPRFDYVRRASLPASLQALADAGEDAKVLAGGQSLVPMMNFRLARPTILVDVSRVDELQGIRDTGASLVIGAGVRQREAERSSVVADGCPLLRQAIRHIGHPQIRARGTVGGSLAHADPSAELAGVAVALEAEFVAESVRGSRTLSAGEFFVGPYTSALTEDEILVETRFPKTGGARTAFVEFARRSGDFALAGAAIAIWPESDGRVQRARVAAIAVGGAPLRLSAVEDVLVGEPLSDGTIAEARRVAGREAAERLANVAGRDIEYRCDVLGSLVGRGLRTVAAT
jgi:carbon-monoxide dehydrogenase medium subunit